MVVEARNQPFSKHCVIYSIQPSSILGDTSLHFRKRVLVRQIRSPGS